MPKDMTNISVKFHCNIITKDRDIVAREIRVKGRMANGWPPDGLPDNTTPLVAFSFRSAGLKITAFTKSTHAIKYTAKSDTNQPSLI